MKNRTPAVAAGDVSAWMARLACRSAAAPAVLVPCHNREPKWYVRTAWATSAAGAPAIPTRNSWPTRWASLIRAKT